MTIQMARFSLNDLADALLRSLVISLSSAPLPQKGRATALIVARLVEEESPSQLGRRNELLGLSRDRKDISEER